MRGGKAHVIWGVFGGFVSSCSNLYGTDIQKYFNGVRVWINKGNYRSDSIICRLWAKTSTQKKNVTLSMMHLKSLCQNFRKIQTFFHKSNPQSEVVFFFFLEVRAWLEWRRGVIIWLLWFLCASELEPRAVGAGLGEFALCYNRDWLRHCSGTKPGVRALLWATPVQWCWISMDMPLAR